MYLILNTSLQHTLCLYLHPSYIAYSIYDHDDYAYSTPQATLFKEEGDVHFFTNVKNWLLQHRDVVDAHYQKVHIGIHSTIYSLFDSNIEERDKLFAVLMKFQEDQYSVQEDHVKDDFIITYALPSELLELLNSYFPQATIHYGDSGIMKAMTHKISDNKCVLVNVQPHTISIAYKNHDSIILYNQYTYTSKEDMLYYLIWTYNEMQLDTHSFPLLVYGWIEENAPLFGILYNYIRNVQIGNIPFLIQAGDSEYPVHYFLPLLGLRL